MYLVRPPLPILVIPFWLVLYKLKKCIQIFSISNTFLYGLHNTLAVFLLLKNTVLYILYEILQKVPKTVFIQIYWRFTTKRWDSTVNTDVFITQLLLNICTHKTWLVFIHICFINTWKELHATFLFFVGRMKKRLGKVTVSQTVEMQLKNNFLCTFMLYI